MLKVNCAIYDFIVDLCILVCLMLTRLYIETLCFGQLGEG